MLYFFFWLWLVFFRFNFEVRSFFLKLNILVIFDFMERNWGRIERFFMVLFIRIYRCIFCFNGFVFLFVLVRFFLFIWWRGCDGSIFGFLILLLSGLSISWGGCGWGRLVVVGFRRVGFGWSFYRRAVIGKNIVGSLLGYRFLFLVGRVWKSGWRRKIWKGVG